MTEEIFEEFSKKIQSEIKEKEEAINQKIIPTMIPGQELDDAIFDTVEKIYESFKFYLKKEENRYLEFRLAREGVLRLSISAPDLMNGFDSFHEDYGRPLLGLGFTFNANEQCYETFYPFKRLHSTSFLKTLLVRIFFDVFRFHIDNPTIIEYGPKI